MDFKAAVAQLKKAGPKVSLPFLYVEANAQGKPAILVGNSIASDKAKVLAGVKSPKIATGKMSVSGDNELILKAKGNALATLKAAATKAGATSVVRAVTIGSPDPEEADAAVPGQDKPATPTAPAAGGWNTSSFAPSGQAPRINLGSQRGAPPTDPGAGAPRYMDSALNESDGDGSAVSTSPSQWTTATDSSKAGPADAPQRAQPPVPPARPILPAQPLPPAKKFPDVLRQSPAMAKLLDQRDILRRALEEAGPNPRLAPERRAVAVAKLAEMEEQLEAAQRQLNDTGFVPKQVGAEYEGEHEKQGWRMDRFKPVEPVISPGATPEEIANARQTYAAELAMWEKRRNSPALVTKRFNDDEKQASELSVNDEGRILDAKGKPLNTGANTEYVMDAEQGKLYQFDGKHETTDKMVPSARGKMVNQQVLSHHSSVLGGGDVAGAGGFKVVDGKIEEITNVSGHYKPGVGQTVQTVETLLKQGALLNKEWVDKDGKPLEGKVAELHQRCKVIQQKVAAKLEADPDADVAGDRKSIDAAMAMLAKLGAGPRNSIRDAKVGMVDIKAGMTGIDVKTADDKTGRNVMPATDFLRTGGGNQTQADAKMRMQQQLREEMSGDRERLEGATTHGAGAADPSEQALADAARNLAGRGTGTPDVARTGDQAAGSGIGTPTDDTNGQATYVRNALEEEEPANTTENATDQATYVSNALDEEEPANTTENATDQATYVSNALDEEEPANTNDASTDQAAYVSNALEEEEPANTNGTDRPVENATGETTYVRSALDDLESREDNPDKPAGGATNTAK